MDTNDKKRNTRRVSRSAPRAKSAKRPRRKPDVVYTEAKPFNRNRFLVRLATAVAVALALILGLSIFFRSKNVVVSGAEKYDVWQIKEASGIQSGDSLLTVNRAQISGRIISKLPYVEQVRVQIKLPDTVLIQITELEVSYSVEGPNGTWWLMNASGKLVDTVSAAEAKTHTQILGVTLSNPKIGEKAVAQEQEPQPTETEDQTVPVTVLAKEQLDAALTIVQQLENNSILGQVVSVDVSSIGSMELWYGERYHVMLGDSSRIDYKIDAMKQAIDQSSDYQGGVLDASFTIWPDMVGYTPFS